MQDDQDFDDDGRGRIECAYSSTVELSPKLRIEYACVALRGYYPDDPEKENQDAHIEVPGFVSEQPKGVPTEPEVKQAFFGVFDGHGSAGHDISGFTRDNLPAQLQQAIREHGNDFSSACRSAFLLTDELVKSATERGEMDDEFSGTTAVCVLISDPLLRVANVGDSRVIIGQRRDDRLIAYPLSIDQTPYRQDEYHRTKACGARIMSGDQLDGIRPWYNDWELDIAGQDDDESDPPRLWIDADEVCPARIATASAYATKASL